MPSTVTNRLQGITTSVAVKPPCVTVATSDISLSGLQTISGVTVEENDRVLVKGQSDASENGIYDVSTGTWTRAVDFDGELDAVFGTRVLVASSGSSGIEYELTTDDPIVIGETDLSFSLRYGANATYDRTEAEIAASVVPVSTQYPEGNAFRYMTGAQVSDVLSGALAQDVTAALQIVFDLSDDGVDSYMPPGKYLISDSLTKTTTKNFRIRGAGRRTVLVNKASSSKPTIKLTDMHYARLEDFVISGRAGFPNMGLLIDATSTGLNGNIEIRNISMETNGIGIEVRMANTIELTNFEYWPTSATGSLGVGSSADSGTRKHGFFVDGSIAGNYCNDILMVRPNIIGVDQTISGHALINIGTDQIGGIQGVQILQGELEGIDQQIIITNVSHLQISGGYYDDADILLDNVRYGDLNGAYNADLISLTDCVHVMLRNMAQGDAPSSFVIDSGCVQCGVDNVDFANAPTNSSTSSVFRNWSIAGVRQRDIGYLPWIAAPTFSAGDYTAQVGTWTVASGDVANLRSHLDLGSKKLHVEFDIVTTTTASSPTALQIKIPGGYTAGSNTGWFLYTYSEDNGTTNVIGQGRVIAGSTNITLYKLDLSTAFANVTDLLLVRGQCEIELA